MEYFLDREREPGSLAGGVSDASSGDEVPDPRRKPGDAAEEREAVGEGEEDDDDDEEDAVVCCVGHEVRGQSSADREGRLTRRSVGDQLTALDEQKPRLAFASTGAPESREKA